MEGVGVSSQDPLKVTLKSSPYIFGPRLFLSQIRLDSRSWVMHFFGRCALSL